MTSKSSKPAAKPAAPLGAGRPLAQPCPEAVDGTARAIGVLSDSEQPPLDRPLDLPLASPAAVEPPAGGMVAPVASPGPAEPLDPPLDHPLDHPLAAAPAIRSTVAPSSVEMTRDGRVVLVNNNASVAVMQALGWRLVA